MLTHSTAEDYRTALAVVTPPTVNINSISGAEQTLMTYIKRFVTVLFSEGVVEEATWLGTQSTMPGPYASPFEPLEFLDATWLGTQSTMPGPSPALNLLKYLETLKQTPMDERWPDADWPTARTFEDAERFIYHLPLTSIPMPEINLANDGEVNFLWENYGVLVDLGFYGTHTYSYFARGKDGLAIHGDDIPISEGLPSEIISLLSA